MFGMRKDIFYPTTGLFPHQPQVLHQMTLQFFLMAEKYESIFTESEASRLLVVPYGSYFDAGLIQAAAYRYWLQAHKPTNIYLISFEALPAHIQLLGTSYTSLHTFFGELKVADNAYSDIANIHIDNDLFTDNSEALACQLPFLRSYQPVDEIVPLIINKSAEIDRTELRKSIVTSDEKVCYIFCLNELHPQAAKAEEAYISLVGEKIISSLVVQRTV